jgi:hypothetical protein
MRMFVEFRYRHVEIAVFYPQFLEANPAGKHAGFYTGCHGRLMGHLVTLELRVIS